jgi:hypothetical protein
MEAGLALLYPTSVIPPHLSAHSAAIPMALYCTCLSTPRARIGNSKALLRRPQFRTAGAARGSHATWAEVCYNAERDGMKATANP